MEESQKTRILNLLGINLKKHRKLKGYSYRELAQLCDVDHSQISKIEKGQISLEVITLCDLAKGLGVHPKELLDIELELESHDFNL